MLSLNTFFSTKESVAVVQPVSRKRDTHATLRVALDNSMNTIRNYCAERAQENRKSKEVLLYVLRLLANLFNLSLHINDDAAHFRVVALRADGIRLAVELLHEEIELAPYRLRRAEHLS